MKVYELINLLSNCPAGAKVEFHQLISKPELETIKNHFQDNKDEEFYILETEITEIAEPPEKASGTVYIYG